MTETITVVGNIANDPEQRTFRGDETVTSFRVACTQRVYDSSTSTWGDGHTSYYNVSAFRALGKNAYAALRKGQRVVVTGRLRVRNWDNGTTRGTAVDIDADALGHDLKFGVTRFDKAGTPMRDAEPAPAPEDDGSAAPDAWAVPQGSLVGANTGAPGAGDTPF